MAAKKYFFTPEHDAMIRREYAMIKRSRDSRKVLDILEPRIGFPRHIISMRAQRLGVAMTHKPFAAAELRYIENYAGDMSSKALATALGRSYESVKCKINRLGFSGKVNWGYSVQDIEQCFGVSYKTVCHWLKMKWLSYATKGTAKGYSTHQVAFIHGDRISEACVRYFIQSRPEQYDLRKVDQAWFKGVIAEHWKASEEALKSDPAIFRSNYEPKMEEAQFAQALHQKMRGVMAEIGAD